MSQSARAVFYNQPSVTSVSGAEILSSAGFLSDKSSPNNSNCSVDNIQASSIVSNSTESSIILPNKLGAFSGRNHLRSSLRNHSPRGRSPNRKTVCFFSKNSDKKVSNVNDCLQIMQNGTEMIKVRTHVRQFKRHFSLDTDFAYVRWQPTNKKPHKARLAVDSIKEIRVGRNTEQDIQDECIFSIIHGDNYESLDLIALQADDANIWITGLLYLTSGARILGVSNTILPGSTLRERWLESIFVKADENQIGFLSEKQTVKQIRAINDKIVVPRIKQKLKEVIASQDDEFRGRISMAEFVDMYKDLATRPELYFLMVRYANKDYLTTEDLQLFLETEQGVSDVTKEMCEEIILKCEPSDEGKNNSLMTVDGFTNFLLTKDSSVFDPAHLNITEDMDHPFKNYFIASSFNTYMVEDQVKGPSSVDGYISALKRSCRVIDLDLWDSIDIEDKNEPMIHNSQISSCRLPLSAALQVIRDLAFETTSYPLFIRLEIHMSLHYQRLAYEMIEDILKELIYHPIEDVRDWTDDKNVPSPKRFQNKILFIGKKYSSESDVGEVIEDDKSTSIMGGKKVHSPKIYILKEFSDLIPNFLEAINVKKEGINATDVNSLSNYDLIPKHHLVTINEGDCLRIMQNYPADLTQVIKEFITRAAPDTLRVDSSNLNPQEFWNFGIQMVALNYQTPGLMMDLQEGKFSANGRCGYVLKPAIMREDLFAPCDRLPYSTQILHLRILSGQTLPRPRGSTVKSDSADPFVVVEIFGIPSDCAEERTKTVRNESVNPNFDESLQFQISVPELALVRFLVLDDDFVGDDFIGQYTIPFECLQSGYRHIPLLNSEGDLIENSTLFIHIAITNRRGGGKKQKRGMSVKLKTNRIQTGMKQIGIKSVDELFKAAVLPLVESIEMRNKMDYALSNWQEQTGLNSMGTIRQGLRLMYSRINSINTNGTPPVSTKLFHRDNTQNKFEEHIPPSFYFEPNEVGHPVMKRRGVFPETLLKTFSSMEALFEKCSIILSKTDSLLTKLEEATKKIGECYEDLPDICITAGLRSQKATRATENFAWNVRLLKSQLALMHKSQLEASDIFTQVFDTAKLLGILKNNNVNNINNSNGDKLHSKAESYEDVNDVQL